LDVVAVEPRVLLKLGIAPGLKLCSHDPVDPKVPIAKGYVVDPSPQALVLRERLSRVHPSEVGTHEACHAANRATGEQAVEEANILLYP
jgi:hypothetical protein